MPHDLVEMYLQQALTTLRLELRECSFDVLVQLAEDRSVRRDRKGRARNSFTVLWDNRCLTDDEVRAEVLAEIERRRRAVALPERLVGLLARVRRHQEEREEAEDGA